jgi:hypothetical protein
MELMRPARQAGRNPWSSRYNITASPPAENKAQDEENNENEEQDLSHIGCTCRDAEKAEDTGHKGDDQKNQCPA